MKQQNEQRPTDTPPQTPSTRARKRARCALASTAIALLSVLAPHGAAPGVHAATTDVVDQQATTNDAIEHRWGIGYDSQGYLEGWGQTFTAGITGNLDRICLDLGAINALPTGNLTVQVFNAAGGVPTGSALASGLVRPSQVTVNRFTWTCVPLREVSVLAGTHYAIELTGQEPAATNYYTLEENETT